MCGFKGTMLDMKPMKFDIFFARYYHSRQDYREFKVRPVLVLQDSNDRSSGVLCAPIVTPHRELSEGIRIPDNIVKAKFEQFGDVCVPIINDQNEVKMIVLSDMQVISKNYFQSYNGTIHDQNMRDSIDKSLKYIFGFIENKNDKIIEDEPDTDTINAKSDDTDDIESDYLSCSNNDYIRDDISVRLNDFLVGYSLYLYGGYTAKYVGDMLGISPGQFYSIMHTYENMHNIKRANKKITSSIPFKYPVGFRELYKQYYHEKCSVEDIAKCLNIKAKTTLYLINKMEQENNRILELIK